LILRNRIRSLLRQNEAAGNKEKGRVSTHPPAAAGASPTVPSSAISKYLHWIE
jgi:hypothetical protein